MAKLLIHRTSEWYNKLRCFKIFVDDTNIGKVGDGETTAFKLAVGTHKLTSKIDWCRSKTIEFEIKENETKTIELSSFKYSVLIIPILLVILLFNVIAIIGFNIDLSFLPFVLFCYPVYFYTIGKNRYIRLTELN